MEGYKKYLLETEKSEATVKKYLHDIKNFLDYCGNGFDKETVISYKSSLCENYSLVSANSMIASLNNYLKYLGREELCVKQFKVQRKTYCSEEKELSKAEYQRLLKASLKNERLNLILQTICTTGIRISELKYITAASVRRGEFTVSCKNKTRTVFIVRELRKKLLSYIGRKGITDRVFVTKSGKAIDRTSIWREMKRICESAKVKATKVFPHNLRHLFARTFYAIEKDIAKLADILGHSSIDTTRIYIITTGAEHRRIMEKMKLLI